MFELIIAAVALIAGAVATVTGFGIGSILTVLGGYVLSQSLT